MLSSDNRAKQAAKTSAKPVELKPVFKTAGTAEIPVLNFMLDLFVLAACSVRVLTKSMFTGFGSVVARRFDSSGFKKTTTVNSSDGDEKYTDGMFVACQEDLKISKEEGEYGEYVNLVIVLKKHLKEVMSPLKKRVKAARSRGKNEEQSLKKLLSCYRTLLDLVGKEARAWYLLGYNNAHSRATNEFFKIAGLIQDFEKGDIAKFISGMDGV